MPVNRVYVVAEIGINHNGSMETARELIRVAAGCGADAVKVQKRTVEVVYSAEELARPRESVFGATNGDLKRGLEFSVAQHGELREWATQQGLDYGVSCWDEGAVAEMERGVPSPDWYKVASACVTDHGLLRAYRETGRPVLVSTGMSTVEEIEDALRILEGGGPVTIMHCTSTYPTVDAELNLACLAWIKRAYPGYRVGFSSHSVSPWPAVYAAVLGAEVVEAHLTLDRAMWGSDQAASLEPKAFAKMVTEIRALPTMLGDGKKVVYPSEEPIKAKLRRYV